jgi:glyoxylase-like metal-dependent hydrolase (beta-lactamase superfamily II)
MSVEGWNVIDESAGVLSREYEFSRGAKATTMVFRGTDGLVVVSPGRGLTARDYDALRELGEVRALIANNAYHHLGQAAWRERFPEAESYAPLGSIARLAKQSPGIPYRPLRELSVPPHVHCDDAPGFKGETIVRVGTTRGPVWYSGDLLVNMQGLPPPPVRWLFTATDSAPGFKLFRLAVWLLVKDKKTVRAWTLARLAETPPAVVVPAHGPAFEAGDVAAAARAQIERL